MSETKVPDEEHLMRFVPMTLQVRDAESNDFMGIAGAAFAVRESDDGGLSVTWIEHYGPKSKETIERAAAAFRDSLLSRRLGGKACFAVGQAGLTRSTAAQFGKAIRLVHAPDGTNTGHVEIRRFSDEDRALLDALALDVYHEHWLVADLDVPT